jgi:predicted RNA binding protein YcfA (HicA-like mRNA interferase family)
MKRRELIRRFNAIGCVLVRRGGKHDWYQNPSSKVAQPVPRHTEIKDTLASHILKQLS